MGLPRQVPTLAAEFFGTFLLLSAVCHASSPQWGAAGIAFTLMVAIYGVGRVSGAHLNPAVTAAIAGCKKIELKDAAMYVIAQCAGGTAATMLNMSMYEHDGFTLDPHKMYPDSWMPAAVAECLYTFMLCFTVLNVAVAGSAAGNNFFGLAIGFVILAGGYGVGGISGGCFNPAVSIALDATNWTMWSLSYTAWQLGGSLLAVIFFRIVHPEEFGKEAGEEPALPSKLTMEFLGTFFLVLTVGCNVCGGSAGAVLSIGGALMVGVYMAGGVSGGHLNPAVSIGLCCTGRGVFSPKDLLPYICAQIAGAICAGMAYTYLYDKSFGLGIDGAFDPTTGIWMPFPDGFGIDSSKMMYAEGLYTMQLVFIVISTTTKLSDAGWPAEFVGFVVGGSVLAGAGLIGGITGGAMNPAVATGITMSHMMKSSGEMGSLISYIMAHVGGALLAVGAWLLIFPEELGMGEAAAMASEVQDFDEEKPAAAAKSTMSSLGSSASASSSEE